jgi:hypothetical protein
VADDKLTLQLTPDEALVLYEFLARYSDSDSLETVDQAEQRALWNLHGILERQMVEIFDPDYRKLVAGARERLRDPTD